MTAAVFSLFSCCLRARIICSSVNLLCFISRFLSSVFYKKPLLPHATLQGAQVTSIGAIVASVTEPQKMLPYLHAMGIRHLKYKTEPAHYPAVQENLLAVLAEHLSVEGGWTDEMHKNWEEALQIVSDVMIQAAEHPDKFEVELAQAGYYPNGERIGSSVHWELAAV
ncbi:MAG TPA: globin domain-containing protein [Oculatellaceae cyanobacterium]